VGDPVVVQKIADDEAARPKADRQPRPQRRLTWGQPEKRVAEAQTNFNSAFADDAVISGFTLFKANPMYLLGHNLWDLLRGQLQPGVAALVILLLSFLFWTGLVLLGLALDVM
jgi:hypothetical protein